MSFGNFTCSKCGKSVSGTASVCPHCGINLAGVRCSHCGYTGSAADFLGNRCPQCHSVAGAASTSNERGCPQCGYHPWNYFFCYKCGKTNWFLVISSLIGAAVITIYLSYGYISHNLIFDLSAKPDPNTACLTIFFGGIALYGGWMSIAALIWHRKSKGTASKRK